MSAPIRVLIRADAAKALGTGHFARASAVAEALASGFVSDVMLVTESEGEALIPAYFRNGVSVMIVPKATSSPTAILEALHELRSMPEVIFLDHYGEVAAWEAAANAHGIGLVVLDDLDAAIGADVIIRPHGGGTAKGTAVIESGPACLPLSHHITTLTHRSEPIGENARLRLNVCFGGTDPTCETGKAIRALLAMSDIDVDLVVGVGATLEDADIGAARAADHIRVHHAPSQAELANLLSVADMALGAGGVMLWERLCLGVPSLVIAVADNQRPQIDAMVAAGAIRFLGDHDEVSAEKISRAIESFVLRPEERSSMRDIGRQLVDGRGAQRVAGWLRSLALDVRDVQEADGPAILDWRTDHSNWQHNWNAAVKPDLAEHMAWLTSCLANDNCVFRIVMRLGSPVGVVRFDLSDQGRTAYLSIYLVPGWHGQKMGLPVYYAAERALRRSHPQVEQIVSRIAQENPASVRLHRDAGFQLCQSSERPDWYDTQKPLR